jgi:hypothetical protein
VSRNTPESESKSPSSTKQSFLNVHSKVINRYDLDASDYDLADLEVQELCVAKNCSIQNNKSPFERMKYDTLQQEDINYLVDLLQSKLSSTNNNQVFSSSDLLLKEDIDNRINSVQVENAKRCDVPPFLDTYDRYARKRTKSQSVKEKYEELFIENTEHYHDPIKRLKLTQQKHLNCHNLEDEVCILNSSVDLQLDLLGAECSHEGELQL